MAPRDSQNRTHYTAVALLLALLPGCAPQVPEARADTRPAALKVATIEVAEAKVPEHLTLTGTLLANRESSVAADASGRVLVAAVERGDFVKKGAELARLDSRTASLSAAEASAQAKLAHAQNALAKTECARADRLLRDGVISKAEFDRTATNCQGSILSASAADARAALAGKMVGDASIRAPFAGLIAERHIEAGEYVRADTRIVTLVDIDQLRLELSVPESSVARVQAGQPVAFEVQAFGSESFPADVRYVGPSMRRASRDLLVEAAVANAERRLRPGMFATARIQVGETTLPAVPEKAVRKQGSTYRLFAVKDGRIEERVVEIKPVHEGLVPVASGLKAGERVVAEAADQIKDGLRVE